MSTTTDEAAASRAPRLGRAAVEHRVAQLLRQHLDRPTAAVHPVPSIVLLRADPVWESDQPLRVQGRTVRVAAGVSPLGVLGHVTQHTNSPDADLLVILTDQEEAQLGRTVLSVALRQRVHTVDRWALVAEQFGAQQVEPRLTDEAWAAEALMSARPPQNGWPRLPGKVLSRDTALRHLAASRLGLDQRLGLGAEGLDIRSLLRWSALRGATESLASLRSAERVGLTQWLIGATGKAGRALFALIGVDRGSDALAAGVVCQALWSPQAADMERQKGRVDRFFGDAQLDDATMRAFGDAARQVVIQLADEAWDPERAGVTPADANRLLHTVLDRAEALLEQFGAQDAAKYSDVLRSGFHHRVDAVAEALTACLSRRGDTRPAADVLAAHVAAMSQHQLHAFHQHRVERARMALRLVQWLAHPSPLPETLAAGIDAQISDWGWVDHAVAQVWAGEDIHPGLKAAYRLLHERVAVRRRAMDEAFAGRLQEWTRTGTARDGLLMVENLLEKVVAPVAAGDRPVLFLLLDGMSAAAAVQIASEMAHTWQEYDPLGGTSRNAKSQPARRRGVVAALPTLTRVSRASLFAAELCEGGQDLERDRFARHAFWDGRAARLFHKADVRGEAGEMLGAELSKALAAPDTLVGVVLNTIDDALDKDRERSDATWCLDDIGVLRILLEHASYHGRAVIIASDHGHVLERDGQLRAAQDSVSARHRAGAASAGAGEVELAGPRVIAPGQRVVSLWDAGVRYTARKAGYHGGASAAEVTIPLLAFLPLGAVSPPEQWRPLGDCRPTWWDTAGSAVLAAEPAQTEPVTQGRKQKTPDPTEGQIGLDLTATRGLEALLDELLGSDIFAGRHLLTPRKLPKPKIRSAIGALLKAGGILPAAVLGERAGELPDRAVRFATVLQRIFNVDDYPVLSLTDSGRNVRLDKDLLRRQFELKGDV
ncbi:BREX-2 system phosphatase PglZ [Streptomyces sp. NPDC048560]|uniref:BREX-2 system phosphatase PglZ n=1 Tax=Streptomyces sp. NPDC048560 TaxID=3155488 RepID=UPI0034302581